MKAVSKNTNTSLWELDCNECLKVFSLNIGGLRSKFDDIKYDPVLRSADVIFLRETWLEDQDNEEDFKLEGYNLYLTSLGTGKGLATYIKSQRCHNKIYETVEKNLQMQQFQIDGIFLTCVYRGQANVSFETKVTEQYHRGKISLICGHFDSCYQEHSGNKIYTVFRELGYKKLPTFASHLNGSHIDQA